MKVAFYSPHLCLRGTTVALYDYAKFNQDILGNESIILYDKIDARNDSTTIAKFSATFEVLSVTGNQNIEEVDRVTSKEKANAIYVVKGGSPKDGILPKSVKSLIHVIGMSGPENKHGDVWAYASYFLKKSCSRGIDIPVVPYMVHLPNIENDMREELGISKNSIVFGRTGGLDTWNLPFANNVIYDVLQKRKDVYFLFQNTNIPFRHERILHLPSTADVIFKTKFINTCDAMIHARSEGESFGLACAEFSFKNKPVITWNGSSERSHLEILGEKAHVYYSPKDLYDCIINFERRFDDYNCYHEYTPNNIMKKFKQVFLDQ